MAKNFLYFFTLALIFLISKSHQSNGEIYSSNRMIEKKLEEPENINELNNLVNNNQNLYGLDHSSGSYMAKKEESIIDTEIKSISPFRQKDKDKAFLPSFLSGFLLIFSSEIGDKTFILAIFFTHKLGIAITFFTTATTLVLLNAFWLTVGATLPIFIYQTYLNWVAVGLFFFFAIVLLIQGLRMENKLIIDELHEIEAENEISETNKQNYEDYHSKLIDGEKENYRQLNKNDDEETKASLGKKNDGNKIKSTQVHDLQDDSVVEQTTVSTNKDIIDVREHGHDKIENKPAENKKENENLNQTSIRSTISIIWGYSISLILAECGDRSQITAIAIAAIYNFSGVLIGSSLAHIISAFIAVTIGHYFAEHVSEKAITLFGSGLFFIYGFSFLYECLSNESVTNSQ